MIVGTKKIADPAALGRFEGKSALHEQSYSPSNPASSALPRRSTRSHILFLVCRGPDVRLEPCEVFASCKSRVDRPASDELRRISGPPPIVSDGLGFVLEFKLDPVDKGREKFVCEDPRLCKACPPGLSQALVRSPDIEFRKAAIGLRASGSDEDGLNASGSSSLNQDRRRGLVGVSGRDCGWGEGRWYEVCKAGETGRIYGEVEPPTDR
jgi:hypothetical protein